MGFDAKALRGHARIAFAHIDAAVIEQEKLERENASLKTQNKRLESILRIMESRLKVDRKDFLPTEHSTAKDVKL